MVAHKRRGDARQTDQTRRSWSETKCHVQTSPVDHSGAACRTGVRYTGRMERRWRWKITLQWHAASDSRSSYGTTETVYSDSVADLRAVVMAARHDPRVVAFRYEREEYLTGTTPERCPGGHPLNGPSAIRASVSWLPCHCGGHTVYTCSACGRATLDPPPGPGCGAGR
jgi:hypothetical protein